MNFFPERQNARQPLYSLRDLTKEFDGPGEKVRVLHGVSAEIQMGESVAVVGASGSGKSTLLHILGTLAKPGGGEIFFCGENLRALDADGAARLRNEKMGFVFQFHHLLPEFTALENVAMQAIIGGTARSAALKKAKKTLEQVGLAQRADFNVGMLSGGERQRTAIARALVQKPMVLLADEPTGDLDEKNGRMVADLLMQLNADQEMSMIVVTHNPELAGRMARRFELKSGELYEQ
ncbi:MAG: ABC transporter ATP-binding protein [Desulfovibrio sp.]|jgi:lipoprotein-releasing system ATP-binding protein|nr:ABC transporter ATP-binding protein [Desulfovibrio sp.]